MHANQAEASRLTSEADMLQEDFAGLQGDLDAVEAALTAYDAAGLPAVQSDLAESLDDLWTRVTAILSDDAQAAQGVVEGLQTDIETAANARDAAQTAHDDAAAEVEAKAADVDNRQKVWDDLIALTDRRTGELAEVASLRDQVRSAEVGNNTFGAYARISEAGRRLTLLGDELSTEEYRVMLMTAWHELAAAREAVRTARLDLARAEVDLTAKTASLEALTTDRVTVLEQRWQNRLDTPPDNHDAPPAPSGSPAPPDAPVTGS
ncbi:hypothetical protein AB0H36_41730 [Kribbella sp. NPDC050820]|uniref:hypothetical protein n=1 Tax=Kribbella sp. NPDC050820 TaxID=3155408 RepID=UPI0033D38495